MADYTLKQLEEIPDVLGDYPGEMRMGSPGLDAEQVAFTWRRMPAQTGGKGSYGHRHRTQEEIYFVAAGTLEFKLEDEVIEAPAGTSSACAPSVARRLERGAGGRGADHVLGQARRPARRDREGPRLLARLGPVRPAPYALLHPKSGPGAASTSPGPDTGR